MTTGYPLDNPDFKGNFQEGAMYLHKQQVLQGDVKAIEKLNLLEILTELEIQQCLSL